MTLRASDGAEVKVRFEVNRKARRLILRLDDRRREAVAVAPSQQQLQEAADFARERVDWISARLQHLPQVIALENGAIIGFRGEPCVLALEGSGRLARLESGDPNVLRAPGAPETFSARILRYLKKEAKADLTEAVAFHAQTLGVKPSGLSVKDTRSRWGSCSATRRLSFSWRLVLAPPRVLSYVAAHECAHILEMNHSDAFWAQVERCVPDWKRDRDWLKAHGAGLQAVGV